mmetsp:Transcript_3246/g.11766  ORF Transcript_3246/g.11766 Transcript_3246/m.11766 type:complete len:126 (-) Transcript_3246:1661-2038(-)
MDAPPNKDAIQVQQAQLVANAGEELFARVGDVVQAELRGTCEEYKVLCKMNRLAAAKYEEVSHSADRLATQAARVDSKVRELQPYLAQIETIEAQVLELEAMANMLDRYTKGLETKLKEVLTNTH